MARTYDHPRKPCCIQHAFFLVEIPAAVLLRHQPALEPVGKPSDNALKPRQLAVEIGPQTVQFLGIAKISRLDHFVKSIAIGFVVKILGKIGPRPVRAHGHHPIIALVAGVAIGHFALALSLLGFAFCIAFLSVARHFG